MDLLLIINENKSYYVYTKDFDRFMFHKKKNKNKNYFCKSCSQYFSSRKILTERKVCLRINGAQSVRLEKGTTKFKNYFKQVPVPFKFYANFECDLINVKIYEGSYSKKYQYHIPRSFTYKLASAYDKSTKPIVVFRGKNAAYEFIKAIPKEFECCKKVMKKNFNKNLIMTEEDEEQFQSSNTCWICEKLIGNEKIRDHCHITRKCRSAAHWSCNINLQLTKKVPAIFHNLRGYDSHLIFDELKKIDVKIDVITSRLEKYTASILDKNLVLIDSMQFMNSSLEKLVKNLADNDFKYLTEKLGSKNCGKILKEKGAYPYEYMDIFKGFSGKKISENVFTAL